MSLGAEHGEAALLPYLLPFHVDDLAEFTFDGVVGLATRIDAGLAFCALRRRRDGYRTKLVDLVERGRRLHFRGVILVSEDRLPQTWCRFLCSGLQLLFDGT